MFTQQFFFSLVTVIGQDGVVTEIPKETIPQSIVDLQSNLHINN